MDTNVRDTVHDTFLFRGVDIGTVLYALESPLCRRQSYDKGSVVYSTSHFEKALGIVLEGTLLVSKPTEGGRLIVGKLSRGDLFGAAALYSEQSTYASDIEADTACEVLFLPQELISGLMHRDFLVAENYIRYLSGRIRFLSSKVAGLAAGSAESKLICYLLENSTDGCVYIENMSELSSMLSIGRASLYRALDSLAASGAVERAGKTIYITDYNKLQSEEH